MLGEILKKHMTDFIFNEVNEVFVKVNEVITIFNKMEGEKVVGL